jgi:hypothetical protein
VACPFCGHANVLGSNICGGCLRNIRHVANPERTDFEETMFEHTAPPRAGFFRRLWRRLFGR